MPSPALPHAAINAPASKGVGSYARILVETTKPKITRLVCITTGVGYALAALGRPLEWTSLAVTSVACLVGTALSAGGANALNQWAERDRDAVMTRTCQRPIPRGSALPHHVLTLGLVLSMVGVGLLWALCGLPAAVVSAVTILTYVLVYTPLKPVSTLATIIGAIPGALPPLIGWAAARSGIGFASLGELGGWTLFLLMLVWQIPHFLAIAWMYKDDYARGGYRVLPVVDETGTRTSQAIMVWTACLVPASLAPALAMPDRLGWLTIGVGLSAGVAFLWLALRLVRERTRKAACRVFFASIVHLPLILMVMVVDALLVRVMRG